MGITGKEEKGMNKVLALLAVLLTFGVSALAETPKETYDRWMQAVSPEYG